MNDCREEFEKWYEPNPMPCDFKIDEVGRYLSDREEKAWEVWKAAWDRLTELSK